MKKILAIDDNNSNLISLEALIEDALPNSIVYKALTGIKGIELAIEKDPDVILLDVLMPGMDGFEVCQLLKKDEHLKDTPIVFLTVIKDDKESRIKALELGADAFLSKPIDKTELIAHIKAMGKIKARNRQKQTKQEKLSELVAERTRELEQEKATMQNLLNKLKIENEYRKLSNKALFESRILYNAIVNGTNDLIWSVDHTSFGLLSFNDSFRDYFKLQGVQIKLGDCPKDLFVEEYQHWQEMYQRALREGSFNIEYQTPSIKRILELNFNTLYLNDIIFGISVFGKDITERKKAETKLLNSEEKFRAIFKNNANAIAIVNFDTTISMVNEAWCEISGYSNEEVIGMSWTQLVTPEALQYLKEYNSRRLLYSNDVPDKYEFSFFRKDGEKRYGLMSVSMIHSINKIATSSIDITEQKQKETELRISLDKLSKIFASSPSGISINDFSSEYPFLECNEMFEQMFGYTRDEIIGTKLEDLRILADPDDKEKILLELKENNRLRNFEHRFRKKDGEIGIGLLSMEQIELNNKHCLIVSNLDISMRKKAEEALIDREIQYRNLFKNAPVGIFHSTLEGKLLKANPAIANILGYSIDELINKVKTTQIYADPEIRVQIIEDVMKQDGFHKKEVVWIKKDGCHIIAELTVRKVFDSLNEIPYLEIFVEDITEKKKILDELIIAKEKAEESDRLKTAFLQNISHEVRTPMNAIVGFSNFLNEPDLLSEERKEFTDIIVQNCNQLLSIITDIVTIATIEAGQEKLDEGETNINMICKSIYDHFLSKSQKQCLAFHYKTSLNDKDALIITDEIKIKQVLTNMVSNAFKFTQKGSINFGYTIKDNHIEFYIKDTGIGIPSDKQREIFNRFQQVENGSTRQFGGSGLGLSISKAYVELLGGTIRVVSESGKGSEFFVTIPFNKSYNSANNPLYQQFKN
ncbi:MAG: PAS domain S-box protein [Bacteroidetes bacterium]|nr:PAS domain S-box protein [Bacteroidota bacterium]